MRECLFAVPILSQLKIFINFASNETGFNGVFFSFSSLLNDAAYLTILISLLVVISKPVCML